MFALLPVTTLLRLGKYSNGDVYDPLNLSSKFDVNWLREAEIQHGRVCMLAVCGWLANDKVPALRFPGVPQVSSLEAHDATVASGHMWALLLRTTRHDTKRRAQQQHSLQVSVSASIMYKLIHERVCFC